MSETKDVALSGTVGFWVMLNQAPGLEWPQKNEGPFNLAWSLSTKPIWSYGLIKDIGNTRRRGRDCGMPFAVVYTTWRPKAKSPGPFMYRRNHKAWVIPCGCAAYIWLEGAFPNTGRAVTEMHSLKDFVDNGASCVVDALVTLRAFIETVVDMHYSKGSFRALGSLTGRTPKNLLQAYSRRKRVTDELRRGLAMSEATMTNANRV